MILDENLFNIINEGTPRGPYKKKEKPKLSFTKIYDALEDLGYNVRVSNKLDNSIYVSKKHEKNLNKAIDYCNELGLTYDQRYSNVQDRYYLDIHLPEGLKEDLILDPTEEDKKLLNDLLDKYRGTEYERVLDQLKSKYEFEDTFGEKNEELVHIGGAVDDALKGFKEIEDKKKEEEKDKKEESLTEDLSQEEQQEYGLNTLINELIKSEYDAIDDYNSAIVTLEAENQGEYTDVIRSIIEDERHHIGNLQEIMNRITPGTEQEFEKGKEEAIETLAEEKPKEENVETIKDVELEDSALQA